MGTSKHVVVLLAMTLGGLLAAGQDQAAASAPSSQPKASNTRSASCIVRITVDPTIMPLSLENIESLLHSSGVAVKAGREVLGLNEMQVFNLPLLKVEWLNASSAPRPSGARSSQQMGRGGPDEEMMRQMEQIYGADTTRQMNAAPDQQKKEEAQARAEQSVMVARNPGESDVAYRVRLNQLRAVRAAQQEAKARGAESMGGIGGMGGVGMGGGVFSAQEPSTTPSRVPGESDVAYRTRLNQLRAVQQAQRAQQQAVRSMGNRGMGMGGGMMAGYGGMGFYGAPGSARQGEGVEQTATVQLVVDLPEDVPPRADEFLQEVISNFQNSLSQAYERYVVDLRRWLNRAGDQRHAAEAALEGAADDSAATQEVRRRLDTMVDLSALNPQMPLNDAVELLKKSVDPPLNIVVLWKDVETNLLVQPSSPANLEGSPRTKLRTALDLLVKGLYDGSAKPMWKIRDDTIVIGTAATLGQAQEAAGQSQVEADAVNLAGERSELARRIQALELDLAGLDARQKAVREQIAATQAAANQRLAEDSVTRELQRLLATSEDTLAQLKKAADAGRASMVDVSRGEEGVAKARIDLARRQEELTRQAGGGQLEEFTKELSRMAIDKAEKEAQLQIVRKQLDEVQKQLMQALTFDPEAARLRLAQEALDITGRRVAELQTQIANLQPPTVLVIGAN
jgi:hypothetical protein